MQCSPFASVDNVIYEHLGVLVAVPSVERETGQGFALRAQRVTVSYPAKTAGSKHTEAGESGGVKQIQVMGHTP